MLEILKKGITEQENYFTFLAQFRDLWFLPT